MKRLGLALLIAAAVTLAPTARAADAVPPTTLLGVQFALSGGASVASPHGAFNADLQRTGWPALVRASPAFQIRMGVTAFDVSLNLNIGGTDVSLPGKAGSIEDTEQHRVGITAEFGYRLHLSRQLSVNPYVGVGALRSTLCFAGHPDASSATSLPPFEQVLRNPGRKTCLDASTPALDVGLSVAWSFKLMSYDDDDGSLYLSVGPRIGYGIPLSTSRTWSEKTSSLKLSKDFPSFEGPVAPLGGAYLGLEVQIRFDLTNLTYTEDKKKTKKRD